MLKALVIAAALAGSTAAIAQNSAAGMDPGAMSNTTTNKPGDTSDTGSTMSTPRGSTASGPTTTRRGRTPSPSTGSTTPAPTGSSTGNMSHPSGDTAPPTSPN